MQIENQHNTELAVALFNRLGEKVPYCPLLEKEAEDLYSGLHGEEEALHKIIELCGVPLTPCQLYVCTRAYSWLGGDYRRETVSCARAYLETPGWNALPDEERMENGILINLGNKCRAVIYTDLADALSGLSLFDQAYSNYIKAFDLEPYNAIYAIKAANALIKIDKTVEAMDFLALQRRSFYYKPVKYLDELGKNRLNDTFRRLIDLQIQKLNNKK